MDDAGGGRRAIFSVAPADPVAGPERLPGGDLGFGEAFADGLANTVQLRGRIQFAGHAAADAIEEGQPILEGGGSDRFPVVEATESGMEGPGAAMAMGVHLDFFAFLVATGPGDFGFDGHGSIGEVDSGDGHGGDAFAAAEGAEVFVGGGFDADVTDVEVEGFGDIELHALDVGGDLGFLGDEGGVDIDQAALVKGDLPGGFLEEDAAGDILPAGIGVFEEMADIIFTQGAEDGIADGMQEGIGIRVSIEASEVGNFNAAEDQFPAFDEGMDIVSDADADHGRRVAGAGTGVTKEGGGETQSSACAWG